MKSLLDTALRIVNYKPEPFIAPVPTTGVVDILILQNQVPLHYVLHNEKVGWWEITPNEKRKPKVGREANVSERIEYLNVLPRFYVIACVPSGEGCWLVVPYNASDASQRGWKNGEPKQVYLINEQIQPFDVLVVRNLAGLMLYDDLDYRLGSFTKTMLCQDILEQNNAAPNGRDWNNAYNIIFKWQKEAEQLAGAKKLQEQLDSVKGKMQFLLEFMGAKLVDSQKKGNGYVVIWQAPDGHTYKMGVHQDGRISVAGFCLNGTDNEHNLSSIVQVMEEAHRRKRPDIQQAYADHQKDIDPEEDYDYNEDDDE